MEILKDVMINGQEIEGPIYVMDKKEKEKALKEDQFLDVGPYGRVALLYMEEHYPELLEKMKRKRTITTFLNAVQDTIAKGVRKMVQEGQELNPINPAVDFMGKQQQITMLQLQAEEIILHGMFPFNPVLLQIMEDMEEEEEEEVDWLPTSIEEDEKME